MPIASHVSRTPIVYILWSEIITTPYWPLTATFTHANNSTEARAAIAGNAGRIALFAASLLSIHTTVCARSRDHGGIQRSRRQGPTEGKFYSCQSQTRALSAGT